MMRWLPQQFTLFDYMILAGGAINMIVVVAIVSWFLLS